MGKWKASDELDGIALGAAEEERSRAKAWMDTAALAVQDTEYWRGRAIAAEATVAAWEPVVRAAIGAYALHCPQDVYDTEPCACGVCSAVRALAPEHRPEGV